jgi:hypothetical protein
MQTDATADEWECKQRDRLREIVCASDINITSLAPLQHDYPTTPDSFWQFREQPNPEETRRRARLEAVRPIRNILVRQIDKRFGPRAADETRSILEQIDDVDLLLELTGLG